MPNAPSADRANVRLFSLRAVAEVIERDARKWRFRETGGPLFGYWTADQDLVLNAAGLSGPRSRRSVLGFQAERTFEWELIEQVVRDSEGAYTYVGDWHTHPIGSCFPSARDRATAMSVAASPEAGTAQPVLWIASQTAWPWRRARHGCFLFQGAELRQIPVHSLSTIPG